VRENVGVTPLGTPMIKGSGAITTVMVIRRRRIQQRSTPTSSRCVPGDTPKMLSRPFDHFSGVFDHCPTELDRLRQHRPG
jgi:hypothetical protein